MILLGDCMETMKSLEANSIDAVVTDPPYGWRFMGKAWDAFDIKKVLERDRSEGDTKTTASMSAGKYNMELSAKQSFQEFSRQWAVEALRVLKPGAHMLVFCGPRTYHRMASGVEDAGFEIRDQLQWLFGSGFPKSSNQKGDWKGWGSALKPANEPIVLARKPLEKGFTLAQNVLKWGCGALNIDGSRISTSDKLSFGSREIGDGTKYSPMPKHRQTPGEQHTQGRWPANILFDEEAAAVLDEQASSQKLGRSGGNKSEKIISDENSESNMFGKNSHIKPGINSYSDSGGASRFFYVAKASKKDRGENNGHPTVKPTKLMEYLCKLITPPNGTVLDPFTGSGSTGVAAVGLGFNFIGCEMNEEYVEIAKRRIAAVKCPVVKEQMEFEA